jgi:CubicO group peptidase (beta-lactamase class C family)
MRCRMKKSIMAKQHIRLVGLLLCSYLIFSTPGYAQDTLPNLNGFDDFVEQVMKDWKVPGVAVAIVKDGRVVYAQGYGYRDVKQGLKVTPDTLFAIGSCSKAFAGASLGILVDEKKLEWDKLVRTYLPELMLYDDYSTTHIRPRDLVSHQSGLPGHDAVWARSPLSRKELFDRLRYLEPSQPLHAKYQYSNLMFMTAGVLVEKVSGITWEEFVRRKILEPIGMKNTNFSINEMQKASDFSLPYREEKGEVKEIPFIKMDAIGPAGSINSSVDEMTNWLLLQLNKGRFGDKQIISEKRLLETQTPQIIVGGDSEDDESFYNSYAMGWFVRVFRGRKELQHGGGIDGFTSVVKLLPKDRIGVVVLTNSQSRACWLIAANAQERLLGLSATPYDKEGAAKAKEARAEAKPDEDAKRKKDTRPTLALKDYTGQFEHPAYQALTITQEGEQLRADLHGLRGVLKHYHYDIFQVVEGDLKGVKITFLMNGAGEIDRASIPLEPSVKEIIFTRRKNNGREVTSND